jgi:hypothetical protein
MQQEMGVSSVGLCRAQAQYMMTGVEPTDAPPGRQALMGSAVHNVLGEAQAKYNPDLLIEQEVTITMPSGLVLRGHVDEIDGPQDEVTDYKTVTGGAEIVKLSRTGSTIQQRFQRHLYFRGAHQEGLVSARGVTRNVWIDRSGQAPLPFVEQEPYSEDVVRAADDWLTDVAYAAEHGEEPMRDKHYGWCAQFCRYFRHCRINNQPDLLVTDPELIEAADLTAQGRALQKEGKALEDAGKRVLEVLRPDPGGDVHAYVCGEQRVRWSWVNRADGGHFALHVDPVEA